MNLTCQLPEDEIRRFIVDDFSPDEAKETLKNFIKIKNTYKNQLFEKLAPKEILLNYGSFSLMFYTVFEKITDVSILNDNYESVL